jgi:predicted RNase H-like nuclease
MTRILGVDGARGGWMGALTRIDDVTGADVMWLTFTSITQALAVDADVVAVDIPIGLPVAGRRECDLLAKRALGRAHSRVFLAPPRDVLAATSYDDAGARHRAHAHGHGLSVQTWNIFDKIREVDAAADDPRLVEVHPELSFARLAGAVLTSKHRPEGRAARLRALAVRWPGLRDVPRGLDGVDALAAAWSGERWLRGEAESLPGAPPRDGLGRPMRIIV